MNQIENIDTVTLEHIDQPENTKTPDILKILLWIVLPVGAAVFIILAPYFFGRMMQDVSDLSILQPWIDLYGFNYYWYDVIFMYITVYPTKN